MKPQYGPCRHSATKRAALTGKAPRSLAANRMFALTKSELANNHRGRPAGVSSAGAAVRISVRNILILLAASILVMLPVIIVGFPKGADLPNHLQFATSFYDALRAGNIHPGWLAESNFGLGDPRFVFYPPALYYLFAGTRFLTGAWYPAFVVSFVALTFAGGLGAYWWARTSFERVLSSFAARRVCSLLGPAFSLCVCRKNLSTTEQSRSAGSGSGLRVAVAHAPSAGRDRLDSHNHLCVGAARAPELLANYSASVGRGAAGPRGQLLLLVADARRALLDQR